MDSALIPEALSQHLDALESTVNWIVVFALVVSWAGLREDHVIETLGLKIERKRAYYVASALYLAGNLMVLLLFLRIGDLLLAAGERLPATATILTTHPWLLNPYSSFGSSFLSRAHSASGLCLLIVMWFLCNTSMSTLRDAEKLKLSKVMMVVFLAVAMASASAIWRVYRILLEQTSDQAPSVYKALSETRADRALAIGLGLALGFGLFVWGKILKRKMRQRASRSAPQAGSEGEPHP